MLFFGCFALRCLTRSSIRSLINTKIASTSQVASAFQCAYAAHTLQSSIFSLYLSLSSLLLNRSRRLNTPKSLILEYRESSNLIRIFLLEYAFNSCHNIIAGFELLRRIRNCIATIWNISLCGKFSFLSSSERVIFLGFFCVTIHGDNFTKSRCGFVGLYT